MNVTTAGLAVLAEACGMASARALSTLSRHETLNADLAVTAALIRAAQSNRRRQTRDRDDIEAIERRLFLLHVRLADIRAALFAASESRGR